MDGDRFRMRIWFLLKMKLGDIFHFVGKTAGTELTQSKS